VVQRNRWSTHFRVHRYTRTRVLCLHKSYPGNGFIIVSLSLKITREPFFSQPNFFLAIILQLPIPRTRLNSVPLLPSSYPGRLASQSVSHILRPTVSRPVFLGIKPRSGAYGQIFITFTQLRVCWYGAPSLTRGRVYLLQCTMYNIQYILLSQTWEQASRNWTLLYNHFARTIRKTTSILLGRRVYSAVA
jgi:hypothetical protein